jgi:hypothetical protein
MYTKFYAIHNETKSHVDVIKIKRPLGVRYVVIWNDDVEPTIYKASDFVAKFTTINQPLDL